MMKYEKKNFASIDSGNAENDTVLPGSTFGFELRRATTPGSFGSDTTTEDGETKETIGTSVVPGKVVRNPLLAGYGNLNKVAQEYGLEELVNEHAEDTADKEEGAKRKIGGCCAVM